MGITTKSIPDNYECEQCNPRKLKISPIQAQNIQMKTLARIKAEKKKKKPFSVKQKRDYAKLKTAAGYRRNLIMKKRREILHGKKASGPISKLEREKKLQEFMFSTENQYSRAVRTMTSRMKPYVLVS